MVYYTTDLNKKLDEAQGHTDTMSKNMKLIEMATDKTSYWWHKMLPMAVKPFSGLIDTIGKNVAATNKAFKEELQTISERQKDLRNIEKSLQSEQSHWRIDRNAQEMKFLEGQESKLRLQYEWHKLVNLKSLQAVALMFKDTWAAHRTFNAALLEANANLDKRRGLITDTFGVQIKLGASTDTMRGAVGALTKYGFDLRGTYKDLVQYVVQMKEGLGVSEEESVQLARVFGISLKMDVKAVADTITSIVNWTSLAADEATRFSQEIGRGIMNIAGFGGKGDIRGAMGLTAALKDVGGDPAEMAKMFRTMSGGSTQGVMLRGMAGITAGQMLGGKSWAEGLDRFIKGIVQSKKGTESYTIEVEQAAQILGTTTDTVQRWSAALAESNKPITESQKLQDRWKEQIKGTSEGWNRLVVSVQALYRKGLTPLIPLFQKFVGLVTELVDALARIPSWVLTVGALSGAVTGVRGIGKWFGAGLSRLGFLASAKAAGGDLAQSLSPGISGGPAAAGLARTGLFGSTTRAAMSVPHVALATAVFGTFWTLGRALDRAWPNNWVHTLAVEVGTETVGRMDKRVVYARTAEADSLTTRWNKVIEKAMKTGDTTHLNEDLAEAVAGSNLPKFLASGQMGAAGYVRAISRQVQDTHDQLVSLQQSTRNKPSFWVSSNEELEKLRLQRETSQGIEQVVTNTGLYLDILQKIAQDFRGLKQDNAVVNTENVNRELLRGGSFPSENIPHYQP